MWRIIYKKSLIIKFIFELIYFVIQTFNYLGIKFEKCDYIPVNIGDFEPNITLLVYNKENIIKKVMEWGIKLILKYN